MTTIFGYTTASSSIGHYLLRYTLYQILIVFCGVDLSFTQELRDAGSTWKGREVWLLFLRLLFNGILLCVFAVTLPLAALAQIFLFVEKGFWIVLEVISLHSLSYTSFERGTQETIELLYWIFKLSDVKQLCLKINAAHRNPRAKYGNHRTPYIERGKYTKEFVVEFAFADPDLRNEALSILEFNDMCALWPAFYLCGERRVVVLSPFGGVERLPVVRMLMLYTEEHKNVKGTLPKLVHRWHDVGNGYAVREFVLTVVRTDTNGDEVVGECYKHRRFCEMRLQTPPGSDAVITMVKATRSLGIVHDSQRVSQGVLHLSGLTVARLLLSSAISGVMFSIFGLPFGTGRLERYLATVSLWALLYKWGYRPWIGDSCVSIETGLLDYKLSMLYAMAHGSASRLFSRRRSWSNKLFDGTVTSPEANVLELFFATHTLVTQENRALQMAMDEVLISTGDVQHQNDSTAAPLIIHWNSIFPSRGVESSTHVLASQHKIVH